MIRVRDTIYDLLIDDDCWRLVSLDEWHALQALPPLEGIVWRDADATRHRLLAEYHEKQVWKHRADPAWVTYHAEQGATHRQQVTSQEETP